MTALTRRELIEAWSKNEKDLDSFICPDCRSILVKKGEVLLCDYPTCNNSDLFDISIGKLI